MQPLRLACFPYAGGGASIFRHWEETLAPEIEVCAASLPGRETRFCEPPIPHISGLVDLCFAELRHRFEPPFALFGHSMGALIAYELARRIRREGMAAPICLVVSARRAPHLVDPNPPIFDLPPDDFVDELTRYNGTPEAVLQNAELMELLVPMLRADFAASETYEHAPGEPLDCPVLALGGEDDERVKLEHLEAWREHTAAGFESIVLPGDHFFLHQHRDALLRILRDALTERAACSEPAGGLAASPGSF